VLKRYLAPLFPGLKTFIVAWKTWRRYRPAHFRPLAGWRSSGPPLIEDRLTPEVEAINEKSQRYFEGVESREFWLNRPFSDRPADPSFLWRFGLLVSALRFRPRQKILDFGCGTGWTSIMLARMGAEVVGVDIAPAALDLAREAAARDLATCPAAKIRFERSFGEGLDFPDGYFDYVMVVDAFHHLPNRRRILTEIRRVLASCGRFGFSEPGIGHSATESSRAEAARGVLEQDVDLEQLYRTGIAVGFSDLEVLLPPLPPQILTLPMRRMRGYLRGMTWLVPPDFLRKEILAGPMGIFRKGPYPVTSASPRAHRARLRVQEREVSVAAAGALTLHVEATNRSETVWLKEGNHGTGFVQLGAQLLRADGKVLEPDYGRCPLPEDLPEGRTVRLQLGLAAPDRPGRYRLRLDMVNEGICWFAQEGSEVVEIPLDARKD